MRSTKKLAGLFRGPRLEKSGTRDLTNHSTDELRRLVTELDGVIAEHETTNAFLRDLLAQRWFETPVDEADSHRSLQRL